MKTSRRSARGIALAILLAGAAPLAGAQERARGSATPAETVPAEAETRLLLRGFAGEIRVRLGASGEIRYRSAGTRAPNDVLPVVVSRVGGTIEMTPREGTPPKLRILEVVVPAQIFVEAEATDAKVVLSGLRAGLDVRGERLQVDARAIEGTVRIESTGGGVVIEGVVGDVSLRGSAIEGKIGQVRGAVFLSTTDSSLELKSTTGSVEADLRGTPLKVSGLAGPLRLRAVGGSLEIHGLQQGGDLSLTGTPLVLEESGGDVDIETDADVRFLNTDADLHVNSYGGSVHGSGNTGLLEVKTEGGEVTVDQVSGPLRVEGRHLKIDLQHIEGEVFIETVSSEVTIGDPAAAVSVVSEDGNVTVTRAATDVDVKSQGGEVRLLELRGAFQVEAEGDRVEVFLAVPFANKDSLVRNDGGDVEMRFPPGLGLRLSAETRFGRIESNVPGVRVAGGARSAEGDLGPRGGEDATIRILADRDIVLSTSAPVRALR